MEKNSKRYTRLTSLISLVFLGAVLPLAIQAEGPPEIMQLEVVNGLPEARSRAPLSWSVPLAPDDNVFSTESLSLIKGNLEVPAQFTAMARWGGTPQDTSKPLAWVLIDTALDLAPSEMALFALFKRPPADSSSPLRVTRNDTEGIAIETGAATYTLSRKAFRFFDSVTASDGTTYSGPGGIRFDGRLISNQADIRLEHAGHRRISLLVKGQIRENFEYTARIHFYANLSEVKIDFRLENLSPPRVDTFGQPQANDYGCANSVSFDDLSIVLPTLAGNSFRIPLGELGRGGERTGNFSDHVVMVQESSGDTRWNILQGFAPRLQSGVRKRSSTLVIDGSSENGPNQLAGWLDTNGVTVAVEKTWQNFPKAFRARVGTVEIGLFPGEFPRNHELRPGEFKTHTFWVRHHGDISDIGVRARSFLTPLRILPSVERIAATQAAGLLAPRMDDVFPDYENGTDYQITTSPVWREEYESRNILDAISRSQNYGWVDFGDIPTDFEGMFSPYNLKYDALRGLIVHALRNRTNETWWDLASAGARHAADIDIQHSRSRGTSGPRHWYEGGMYGHGYHDEDGRTNPHRNYQNPVTYLSGPNAGMFLWALLAGDTLVLDSAVELADNIYWRTINSDYYADFYGEMPVESRQCALDAGLQVCREGECYGFEPADGSRTGGNILQAMLLAYMATGHTPYLSLISRICSYLDCLDKHLGGLSCDRFHFQTTFIRNLGHYLLFLNHIGLPEDIRARDLLMRRMEYMATTLWDESTREFLMCYDSPDLYPFHDNWLFAVADAFAIGSIVLDRPELLSDFGRKVFLDGSANQFYEGSAVSYHSTKEFVNQIGFGNMFLFAWNQVPPGSCAVSITPKSQHFSYLGGSGVISVTASEAECAWEGKSNVPWISITAGDKGTGNGTVSYSVSANTGVDPRTGTVTVGGNLFTVSQDGVPWRTLSLTKVGSGTGTVVSSPAGILCDVDCSAQSAEFPESTVVTLTAAAGFKSVFSGWQGGLCTGKGPCVVNLNSNVAVSARFDLEKLPDLSATWSGVSRTKLGSRHRIQAVLYVKNGGDMKASSTSARIYISNDTILDATDKYLGSVNIGSLSPGRSISKSVSYSLNWNPKGRVLLGVVDPKNTIKESNEENNQAVSRTIP